MTTTPYDDYYNQSMRRGYGSNSDPYAQGDNGYNGAGTPQSTNNAMTQSLGKSNSSSSSGGGGSSSFGSSFSDAANSWGTGSRSIDSGNTNSVGGASRDGGPISSGADPARDGGPSTATVTAPPTPTVAHPASITDPTSSTQTPNRMRSVAPGAPLPNPAAPTTPATPTTPPPAPPAAPSTPSLAGQQNGQPLAPGNTGENASDKAMRWKQALIAAGDPDGLSQNITPAMIAFYEQNNSSQLDPVAWMRTPGNLDAFNKWTMANPNGADPSAMGVGNLQTYNPQMPKIAGNGNPFNNASNPGWITGAPSSSTPPTSPTPPPGLVDDSKLGPPPGLPPEGATPPPPPSSTPPGLPNETGFGPSPGLQQQLNGATPPDNNSAMQNASSYLRSLLNPQFAAEQRDLSRNINAQAALTGDTQSGGLGEVSARAQGDLISKEGSRVTDYLTQATEADKNRQLQQQIATMQNTTANKQIDTNLAIAQLNDSTTKLGIKTNDDLQRYLNSKNNELQKYGIDAQSVWERYRTEAAQAGANASAGAAYNAALLNSATSKTIAEMNNATQQKANQQQYDLGVLGINATNYRADQSNLIAYLQTLLGAAPSQTTPPPSGFVPYGP